MTKHDSDLFEADRRTEARKEKTDRRIQLRPTRKLQFMGAVIAALVILVMLVYYYFQSRS
jgi:hypothetical protein